jgi:Subtilase family
MVFIHLAGNEQNGGYWQGPFVPTAATIAGSQVTLLDFGIASGAASDAFNAITVPATSRLRLILNWNDPPHDPANRALTAYLLDGSSQVLTQLSAQSDPTLVLDYTNTTGAAQTVRLGVSLDSGSSQGLMVQVTEGSATCNIECQPLAHISAGLAGGTIGDVADSLVVGATFAGSPRMLEAWSNHGPFRINFQAAADPASPDAFDYTRLATPLQIAKPDLVAPDCVTTPFSDGKNLTNNQFCGTSAAVPSIAGAAALLESAGFNRAQVLKALRGTAVPLGPAAWDPGYGFGLADAAAALHSGGN